MKMYNSNNTFLLLAIALVLALTVPLKSQDLPQDYLEAHNRVRASKGVGPLVWSETLDNYAQTYASQRRDCEIILSGGPYGEILATAVGDQSAEEFMTFILTEEPDYSYDTNTCTAGKTCAAYLQVVWRNTVSLGCGKVQCDNGGSFTICNYDPTGNVLGERPY